jgi:uncharacterized protein YdgA (DUF945 family)
VKKGIVFGLIAVVVIVLVSPGVVGRMAESIVEQNNEWAAINTSGSGLSYESESFERGWFVSNSVDRIAITDPTAQAQLVEALGLNDASDLPVLVVATRLDHGLVPITSLSRDGGSLAPALSRTVSTISIEGNNGERVDIPGEIFGHIGFGGTFHTQYLLQGGSTNGRNAIQAFGDGATKLGLGGELSAGLNDPEALAKAETMNLSWGDTTVNAALEPDSGRAQVSTTGDGWSVESDEGFVRIGSFEFASDQTPNEFGIAIGDFDFAIDTVEVREGSAPPATFGPISMEASTSANGDRVSGDTQLYFAASELPGVGSGSVTMDISVTDVDAQSMKRITDSLNTMDDAVSEAEVFALLEPDLRTVLSSGFGLDFKQLDIEIPQGKISSAISLSLPQTDAAAFSWAGILQAMSGSASMSVPSEMVDMALAMNPQAQMVVGMGFLQKNGDVYEMEALYEKGLLTVNGAPIPVPMP